MNSKLRLAIVVLIMLSLSTVSLGKEIVSKELLDSQYGIIGDWLNVGDRFYKVTYDDGTSEELIVSGIPFLKPAYISEYVSSGNVDSSKCYKAILQYRVKTVQDTAQSYSLNHKIEIWRNDYNMNIGDALFREFPNWKVAYTPEFSVSETYPVLQTIQVPYEYGYSDYTMAFDVVEYQQKKTGEWIKLVPGIASTTRVNIKWWSTYQAGSGRGDLMPGCNEAPAQSVPTTTSAPATSLSVSSSPAGATVTSSGTYIGTTPFTMTLSSGESKILTFSKDGYVTQYKGVSAGTSTASVTLLPLVTVPIPTPVPTPTPIPGYTPTQTPYPVSTAPQVTQAPVPTPGVLLPIVTTTPASTPQPASTSTPSTTLPPTTSPTTDDKKDEGTSYLPFAVIIIVIGGGAYVLFGNKTRNKGRK